MTQINGGGQNPLGQGNAGLARDRALAEGRPGDARGSTASLDAKVKPGSRPAASDIAPDRLAAFQRSMRRASVDDGKDTAETRLLASAEWSGGGFTMPAPQPHAVADEPTAHTTQTLASTIAARIEQAFRAELVALASGPTTVAIDLGGLANGLQSLTVTMSSTGLDVTFAHSLDALPEEFAVAAQALAERLSRRFSGRAVRILETTASQAADDDQAESGMQAISGLLGRPAPKR